MSQPHWHNCTATAAMAQTNAIAKRKAADVYRLYQAAHAIQMPTKVAAAEPTTNYNAAVTHCLRCEYTKTTLCTTRSPAGAKEWHVRQRRAHSGKSPLTARVCHLTSCA